MKRCAWCHGRLGLGVRSRNLWNGRWWVHVRFCSTHCEALYELDDTTSTHVAGEPCSTEALTDLIYEGLAEPRLFGLGRGSRFGENWSAFFRNSKEKFVNLCAEILRQHHHQHHHNSGRIVS